MKKIVSLLMALVCVVLTTVNTNTEVYAKEENVLNISKSYEVFYRVGECDSMKGQGPISITKGELTKNGKTQDVYLVVLYGMVSLDNVVNDFDSAQKAIMGRDNAYLQLVLKLIRENIPQNSNIMLAGGSLGGMVAQQVASNSDIKKKYNIVNTITFGSPYINGTKEGTLVRLADKADMVPKLSMSFNFSAVNRNYFIEDGGYGSDSETAHGWSYARSDVWGEYDVTGFKGGNATLKLYLDTRVYFDAYK